MSSQPTESDEEHRDDEHDYYEELNLDDKDVALDGQLTDMEKQYQTLQDVPQRIHILGSGNVGKLIAHSLRSLPQPPPVTLIFHRRPLLEHWSSGPQHITVNRDGLDITATGFEVELEQETRRRHSVTIPEKDEPLFDEEGARPHEVAAVVARAANTEPPPGFVPRRRRYEQVLPAQYKIDHLIVTTKTHQTVNALLPLRFRLKPSTTLCLIQNGMGVIDELNEKVFTKPDRRPVYVQGIFSHGVNTPPDIASRDPFYVVHAGQGSMALGLPNHAPLKFEAHTRYLLRSLTRSPTLVAVSLTPTELLQRQLEKLAVNCVINPLTVLLDSRNGNILHNYALTRTIRLLLAEVAVVIRNLPELQGLPNVATRFSPDRLESLALEVASTTADNISSMLADVRAGRRTEIDYINGYIVKRGEELGIKCLVNYTIMNTVLAKSQMTQREVKAELPVLEKPDLNQGH